MKGKKGFQKGERANPKGRPKGTGNFVAQLETGLVKYKKKYKESFIDNYLKRTKENDSMATALMNKMLPNIQEITGKNGGAIEVKDARSKLFDRFNALANSRKKKASNK